MKLKAVFHFYCLISLLSLTTHASVMKGKVYDASNTKPLADVAVHNIFTDKYTYTDSKGAFEIEVNKGQLVEFSLLGYDVTRIRIKSDNIPLYYNVAMKLGAIELDEVNIVNLGRGKWQVDSAKSAQIYKLPLTHYKLNGFEAIMHPFSALSKENRRIWAFQKMYAKFEKDKYVDYTFNKNIIKELTGLEAEDSLNVYEKQYRPTYDLLQSMSLYEYYDYIKNTVAEFRRRQSITKPE